VRVRGNNNIPSKENAGYCEMRTYSILIQSMTLLLNLWVRYSTNSDRTDPSRRSINLFITNLENKDEVHSNETSLLLYLCIRRVIGLVVVTIQAHRCYHRPEHKFYPAFFCQGEFCM
jgi:hypothetical protein